MGVQIVTDSTAGAADDLCARVVPLRVRIGQESLREGVEITPDELAAGLRDGRVAGTSMPAVDDFDREFRAARDSGADGVVAITLSGAISGTADAARTAAAAVEGDWGPGRIAVIDSRTTAAELYVAVEAAADAARRGDGVENVATAGRRALERTRTVFYVDTLEYLRRGGRIGAASAWVGGALAIKPLLQIKSGEVAPLEKVRTSRRAVRRLVEIAEEAGNGGDARYIVQHFAAAERAEEVRGRLADNGNRVSVRGLSAVIGTHAGPGVVGITVVPDGT